MLALETHANWSISVRLRYVGGILCCISSPCVCVLDLPDESYLFVFVVVYSVVQQARMAAQAKASPALEWRMRHAALQKDLTAHRLVHNYDFVDEVGDWCPPHDSGADVNCVRV